MCDVDVLPEPEPSTEVKVKGLGTHDMRCACFCGEIGKATHLPCYTAMPFFFLSDFSESGLEEPAVSVETSHFHSVCKVFRYCSVDNSFNLQDR